MTEDRSAPVAVHVAAPDRLKGYERWKKCPPDGTSYAYWILGAERPADGGFLIETKPRFRGMGYLLFLPHSVGLLPGYGIRFETLREAKAAAELPLGSLVELHRCSILQTLGVFASWAGISLAEKVAQVCAKLGVSGERLLPAQAG